MAVNKQYRLNNAKEKIAVIKRYILRNAKTKKIIAVIKQ